jgi:hypothetical protein
VTATPRVRRGIDIDAGCGQASHSHHFQKFDRFRWFCHVDGFERPARSRPDSGAWGGAVAGASARGVPAAARG